MSKLTDFEALQIAATYFSATLPGSNLTYQDRISYLFDAAEAIKAEHEKRTKKAGLNINPDMIKKI